MRKLCACGGLCRLCRGGAPAAGCVGDAEVVCALGAGTIHRSLASHHPRAACITSPTATSLAIAVFVVDADEGTSEGQYLTEGDENRMVYLSQRW